jgi:hypothetical protein
MKTYIITQTIHGVTKRVGSALGNFVTIAGAIAFARSYANARKRLGMSIGVITVKQAEVWS